MSEDKRKTKTIRLRGYGIHCVSFLPDEKERKERNRESDTEKDGQKGDEEKEHKTTTTKKKTNRRRSSERIKR